MPAKQEEPEPAGLYHIAIVIPVLLVSAGTKSILSFYKKFCDEM